MVTGRPASLTIAQAERLLAEPSTEIPPLTVAAGPEDLLRDRLVRAFRAGAEAEGSEFLRLEGDDLAAEDLAQALASISLFGNARRIWIREAAKLERSAEETLLTWAAGGGEGVRVLVTSAREIAELRTLQSLASRGLGVACGPLSAPEALRWGERVAGEAGLKLPSGALETLVPRTPNLLAWSREIDKLRVHADPDRRVPASALDVLGETRRGASAERWAAAVLAGDVARARAEAAALDLEGIGGTACLWAVAERALAALDPSSFGWFRRPPSASPGAAIDAAEARRVLDAVYRADRALKRGELRDAELRDFVEREIGETDRRGARGA